MSKHCWLPERQDMDIVENHNRISSKLMENLPIFRHDQVMQLFAAGDYFDPGTLTIREKCLASGRHCLLKSVLTDSYISTARPQLPCMKVFMEIQIFAISRKANSFNLNVANHEIF